MISWATKLAFTSRQRRRGWIFLTALSLGCSCLLRAEVTAANEGVIERYEQILEREPVEGPSFDKLLQIYQDGEGLEKLDARWAPWSAEPGAKGATYSLLRGLLADRMAKTDDARRFLQAATKLQPDDFHGWMALGDFEVREGKWADAIAALQKGLATPVTGDDRLSLYRKLGQAQERNLDVTAALATWQKMVAEFPKDPFALEEAGASELDAEQFDEAKNTFQKLVDLTEPNSMNRVQAMMHLADVDDRQGKTDAAVHDYEAILPLTAESSWLNRELRAQIEQVYRREDDLAGLVTYYQKWTQDNPKDVEALLLLAGTLNELGKKTDALDVLRKVTVLAPDRHEVRESFAQALVEAKQYDEAITVLTALTADDPTEPRYWETMGDALWLKTQPPTPASKKATLDAWSNIAPADTKDVAAVLEVADLCRDHNLNDEALAGYQRALGISPDASDIREKAVKLLVDMKRPDDAWKLLDQMTDGPLATADNYLKLATLDQQFDRKDAAADAVRKGLALAPNNFDLLSLQWGLFAEAQKWTDCIALFDKLIAAAPNAYFVDQLEARHLQALTSAGQLDETSKRLHAKLGADPGLTEGELRLLLRIMVQQSDADIPKALDEAHRRFPQSVSLIRIEIDFNRHQGNYDAAVAALQRLIATAPMQKTDWLNEIVHVRQDQGNFDEALKAAEQLIEASPTSADGYMLYAEIAFNAGKSDDAVSKLQAAIKLSDKPNDVRQRLARYYLESGNAAKARTVYDDAFAAAENPQDKLTIVRAMTAAYFQDGQIEELINRFKKEQNSEEGGWRYGLYLSAIDEQMEDYGAARRELAKSLAVRPNDTGLLHSLIGLADKEGDQGELLRYREMLATADPSPANELALANEYAQQNKPKEAWRIVQKNQAEVVKDPLGWKDVLNEITDPDYAAKIKGILEEAIRSKGDSFEGKFALSQFQMEQGDLENAKATLWEILAQPLPAVPPKQPGTQPAVSRNSIFGYGFYQSPLFQRSSQSYMAINEAQQLLTSAQSRNQMRQQMGMMRSMYGRMGVSATLDPAAIKDHALIYLSVIALQQKQADAFLKDLQAKFDAWHWPLSEKLVAYTLIQAREPQLEAIEEQAKSNVRDKDLDEYCFMACEQFLAPMQNQAADDPMRKRAEAARALLITDLGQDPQFKSMAAMLQISQLAADTSAEGMAKKKAAIADYIKTIDRTNPDELMGAISLSVQAGSWDEVKKGLDDLAATDHSKWSVTTQQQIAFLPMTLVQQPGASQETAPKEVVPAILELLRLSYPATPPHTALANTGASGFFGGFGMGFYNQNTFPPPNRYFTADRVGLLQPMFQGLKARNLLPDMYAGLDQEEKDLNDWRKIYPTLLRVYFNWWDGKHDDSIAAVRTLLEQDPSDDFHLLLASMLNQEQKYDEAIPVLESVSARYGPDYIHTQMELLHTARMAKNDDVGQKAALRLLALRLPQQEQTQILDDLRNVGLKAKADEIVAKQTQSGPVGNINQVIQAGNQLMQTLNTATNQNDQTQAIDIAHQILNRDPMASSPYGNDSYLRVMALNTLKKFGQLEAYAGGVEKQLQATPDSVRLNWLAAEAYQNMDDHVERTSGLAPLPQWLKLQRTGTSVEGFYSLDGKTWVSAGQATLDLPDKIYLGFWVSGARQGPPVQAAVDQIVFTGKAGTADAVPPAANPSPNAVVSGTNPAITNTPPTVAAPSSLAPAPWQQADIGTITQPGSVKGDAKDALALTGPLAAQAPFNGGTHYVYQMLEGDGSVVARFDHLTGAPNDHLETAGIMLRESLEPGVRAATIALNSTRGIAWQSRNQMQAKPRESAGWMMRDKGEFTTPIWLKLARKGNTFTGSCSMDGQSWTDLFSHDVMMGPDSRAGLMSAVSGSQEGDTVWTDIKVTPGLTPSGTAPADATPPATAPGASPDATVLPAPWEFIGIGEPSQNGTAQWTGPELTVRTLVPVMSKGLRSYSFVYQTIHGDGEIVAHLESQKTPGFGNHDGLSFRSLLDKYSPEIELFRVNANQIGYYLSTDTVDMALKYYKKVAELDPKNRTVLVTIAEQLRRAKRPGEAADLYASILKADFVAGMTQSGNVLQVFLEADRLPELVKIIQDWTPPPLNPMGGGVQDMYFSLLQIGNQLRQGDHLPEAEQVYRKALTVETFQSKQDGAASLAQVLMDEGRRDDAAAEVEKWLLNVGTAATATAPPPPILGFNYQIQSNQNNWFQSMNWSQNGVVNSPMIHFLELADELGLSSKLRQELEARVAKKSATTSVGQIDPDRMTCIVMAIMARDPSYRPEVEKMLKDNPVQSVGMGVDTNAFIILSQELEKWPAERPMALRLSKAVYDSTGAMPGNAFFQNIAAQQMIRIALAAGDHKAAQETLGKLAASVREQRATSPGQVQLEQVLTYIRWMIQEGMFKEAADLLADEKTDPQLATNSTYFQPKIDAVQNELAFAKGEIAPTSLLYGIATATGKSKEKKTGPEIFWQLNADKEQGQARVPYCSRTVWKEGMPVRPTTCTIKVKGGPDEEHLVDVASYKNVATSGSAPIKIPPGTLLLRAELSTENPPAPAPATPPTGTPVVPSFQAMHPAATSAGYSLLLGSGENLLNNPDFKVTRNATGLSEVAGWKGVLPAGISQETGGPLPAGGFQTLEASNGMFGGAEIVSDRIALQPNTNYVFGCWMRLSGNIGFRYLDATGKVLNPNQFFYGGNEIGWLWRSWLLKSNAQGMPLGEAIPSQAAFVEIVFNPNQDCDVAGFSFRVFPSPGASAPVAPIGGAKTAPAQKPAMSP